MADPYMPYDGPIVTRQEAIRSGLNRYFSGKECKRGHLSERSLPKSECLVCMKQGHAERYLANPDSYKARAAFRYETKRDECLAHMRTYYAQNCDVLKANTAEYQRQHPEEMRAWRKAWDVLHPETRRAIKLNRRARERATSGSIKQKDIKLILARQRFKCAECGTSIKQKYHMDHIMPLALGGSGYISNMQALCPTCNWRKNAKHPIDWAQENGRLL